MFFYLGGGCGAQDDEFTRDTRQQTLPTMHVYEDLNITERATISSVISGT